MLRVRVLFTLLAWSAAVAAHVRADLLTSEFNSDPVSEGWTSVQQYCDPTIWLEGGQYHQQLDFDACQPPPGGGQDSYTRGIDGQNGALRWFLEFRVATTGDRSDIPWGAPAVLATVNWYGMDYTATVANDRVNFFRDAGLPVLFFDLTPGIAHVIRVELNNGQPETYRWYADGVLVEEGLAEGPFPSMNAQISWRGRAWQFPCENAWDYIRSGAIAPQGSGDFDSSGAVDAFDVFYFDECLARSAAGESAAPSCAWADMDSDNDVDCDDAEQFQQAWAGPGDPPILPACFVDPIPAVSNWGAVVMALLALAGGSLIFRTHRTSPRVRAVA